MEVKELLQQLRNQVVSQLALLQEAEEKVEAGDTEPAVELLCDLCGDAEDAVKTADELCKKLG